MSYYTVEFTYPNGNVEELYERYQSLKEAVDFGNSMLGQVGYNARYHEKNTDLFGEAKQIRPHFVVIEYNENNRAIVFESDR